ncbi:unnamed protein product [Caenorhabditis bovis]|uniref:Histone-lysine N-methyltransferase n=1 Tax=Caenorhabditis bovis TaxID=2654633 RepID=A0A8S1EL41_9PELO|nr:unnamed protein product [Caenorhabditis bovis]
MICIECGGTAFNGGELCELCMDMNGMSGNICLQSAMASAINVCGLCALTVQMDSRNCTQCKKSIHLSCDSSEAGLEGFVCMNCRRTPMVSDIMLTAASRDTLSPLHEPSTVSHITLAPSIQSISNSFTQPSLPPNPPQDFTEIYPQHQPSSLPQPHVIDEISDGATNDSARNSPFYAESSDIDEDFVPGSTRGRGRGAESGAKKKPTRGTSLLKKQTTIPQTGFYSPAQLQALTQPTRGKRGKRGTKAPAKGGGRGRGRGRSTANTMQGPPMMQQLVQNQPSNIFPPPTMYPPVNIPPAIREVDELMMEDETSRQSATRADDAEYVRTIVVCNASDPFLKQACICLICGAVGRDTESSMVACSNCAQTYHTYCVGLHDKLNSTVMFRGWRCLDCTVCEGCGNGGDESKLLLCEECDISYHIYCLRPPLEQIPSGPWRCQWCARCRRCNIKVNLGSDLTRDGICHPCNSLRGCPRCKKTYNVGDKLIRCSQCHKWQHGVCENLYNDEMLEQAALNRMRCTACRPNKSIIAADSANVVICDNVALSKNADEVLKSKFMPSLCRPSFETYGYRDSFDHYGDDDYNPAEDPETTYVQRGRGRGNPGGRRGTHRIGIGGIYAKLPRHRVLALTEEVAAMNSLDDDDVKKMKRPRKPRRSQLEDAYPPAIQEAFFGITPVEGKTLVDISVEEPSLAEYGNGRIGQQHETGHELSSEATEMLRNDINENEFLENMDLHEMDTDLDNVDLSLLFNDDEYDDDFEDSLTGLERDTNGETDLEDIKPFEPTSFSMDQPSSSGVQFQQNPPQFPLNENGNNFAQAMPPQPPPVQTTAPAPVRANAPRNSSTNAEAPERYQFSERWEEDEPLGLQATTAAVLYANEKHGHLKEQYPEWSDRVKQIQRLWRTLSSEERQEYVNRARENRTNRGRQPRPRRAIANSTSVDSPTTQSPGPNQMGRGDGFKVPAVPIGGGTPGYDQESVPPPKQVKITCHLTPEVHQQYRQMLDKLSDLEKVVLAVDADLAKQRKQKKNLAAKKRQMAKTVSQSPDYDGRPVDLNEADKLCFLQLTDSIKTLQSELENQKRELKLHESSVRDFEVKNAILRNESEVTPQMIEQTQMMNQQVAVAHDTARINMIRQQQMMQMQQRMPGVPPQPGGPQIPPGAPMPMHAMRVPQQMPFGAAPPPGAMVRPGGPPLTLQQQQQQEMQRRMIIQQQQQQRRAMRSMILGGVRLDQITNIIEKEVYEVLDDVIIHISICIDGPPKENNMLKRLLDPAAAGPQPHLPPGHPPPNMIAPQMEPVVEGPRPKKKRTVQKKAAQSLNSGSEYDGWVEKMRTRFRLCQEIPRRAKEPPLKNPGAAFSTMAISDINEKSDRHVLTGDDFGKLTMTYVDDYFTGNDRTSRVLFHKDTSMNEIIPNANLAAFYSQPPPPEDEFIFDEYDQPSTSYHPLAVLSNWLNSRRLNPLEHIRTSSRGFDVPIPIEPLRRMFYAESKEGDVEVTITASVEESENCDEKGSIGEVIKKIKDILGLKEDLNVRIDTPPRSPSVGPSNENEENVEDKAIKMEVDDGSDSPSSQIMNKVIKKEIESERCKHCSKSIEGVSCVRQKMGKLGLLPSDAPDEANEETASFCSMRCYFELMATSKVSLSQEEINAAEQHVSEETFNRLKQIHADNLVKAISQGKSKLSCAPSVSMEGLISPKDTRFMMDEGRKERITMIPVSTLTKTNEAASAAETTKTPSDEWTTYTADHQLSFKNLQIVHQDYINAPKMGVPFPPHELDQRQCVLCGMRGDGEPSKCGRLLSLTEYIWVHVNCALWSTEVFENPTGGLMHVDRAVIRASKVFCGLCGRAGASIKCHKMGCMYSFHVLCAQRTNGFFIKDRTFICRNHEQVTTNVTVTRLDALRRIYIQRDENELLAKLFELSDGPKLCLRLGALTFYNIGQLLPEQLKSFHNANFIYPVGYKVHRWFWSPNSHRDRMLFECTISDKDIKPFFTVKSVENPAICYTGRNATEAWKPVFEQVHQVRQAVDMLRFFSGHIHGETLYGLNENVITKITESLPGVDTMYSYNLRHGSTPILELPLAENPMGCARAEPRLRTLIKHNRTKPGASSSAVSKDERASKTTGRTRGTKTNFMDEQAAAQIKALGLSAEYAALYLKGMEPIQSNSQIFSAYQKMRKEWRNTVYLARSKIQGLGLYACRDIAMGDFIIEYKGEIIRSELGEVREKRYNAQNRGVYMFRIDEELIIDATMAGGPARYINHSCDPNCSTRILDAGSGPADKKIIITANRPIMAHEELTYDYQFELEDSTDKIPCLCGAPNCVKWMN